VTTHVEIDALACRHLTTALEFLGRRWNGAILLALSRGADRFSAVLRSVPGLSDRMLAARLKELEQHGAVARTVIPSTPVQIRYQLTPHGVGIVTALGPLVSVGERMSDADARMSDAEQ
jgi:DNA-binding HxlR family transcriptional regulator